ncbi:MAG TPA: glycosyltransferase family 4 protein [Candidatus Sulfotelmatobacter sp.]|nr:glycosyltransferase family 4 protein [Candidatus Sulfotelmatobacter sp.]
MRILYCNKYNYPFSGTEVYLFELMELMRSHGHQVALFSMADPRGIPTSYDHNFVPHIEFRQEAGLIEKIGLAAHAVYSPEARGRIRAMIAEFNPHVAHVRNIYHHLSPSILWELKAQGVPVLYHVNDFKLLCPTYNLVRQGEACEDCQAGAFWRVVGSDCYPGLGARTALMAEAYAQRWLGTYEKCVDLFLAPSQFVRDKFAEHKWDTRKFRVLPHFQVASSVEPPAANGPMLYFGRLSAEKGVGDLLRAMQRLPSQRLIVAGDGPQRSELQALAAQLGLMGLTGAGADRVEFVGHVRGAELDGLIVRSRFTVLPSHAYETLGKSILESYARGRAVVASDLGSRRELVHEGETGLLYPVGDVGRLAETIASLNEPGRAERMGLAGWQLVREQYTPEANYRVMAGFYEELLEARRVAKSVSGGRHRARRLRSVGVFPVPDFVPDAGPAPTKKPRVRVAFIGGRGVVSKYSGIEAYYEEVGSRLAEMGHEVTVYCRNYFTPTHKEFSGMRLVRLPTIRSKHLETLVHTALSTAHALTQNYDIVHYHTLGPALFSRFPQWFGKKTLVTVQGLDWQRGKWGRFAAHVLRLGEWASARLPDKTMVVSQALHHRYRKEHGVETCYVPNGGALREKRAPQKIFDWGLEPDNYILFLGRFSPEKGCHLLVEAYERLTTEVKLVMAGASSYCDDYSRELRTHASDRVKILDWVSGDTLDELLTNAMIFVLPSEMEGLSLALLDAMGAGLCVLASDVPENREVVMEAGYTFRRGDAADLADRLSFLIANPAVRAAAGRSAKVRIRDYYLWPKIAADIEKVYFQVLGLEQVKAMKKPSVGVVDAGDKAGRRAG